MPCHYVCQLSRGCRGDLLCMTEDKKQRANFDNGKEIGWIIAWDDWHADLLDELKKSCLTTCVKCNLGFRNHNGNHKIGRGTRDIDTLVGRRSGEQEKGMFLPLFSSRIFPFCFQYFHLLSRNTRCGTSLTALIFTLYINFYYLYFSSAQSRKQK